MSRSPAPSATGPERLGIAAGVVDAHLHFWDVEARTHPWLAGDVELGRTFVPDDLDTGGVPVTGMVAVQADCAWDRELDEVDWFEQLAAAGAPIHAVVAAAPLELGAEVAGRLARLAERPLVAGVRRLLQDEPAGFAVDPDFVDGVRLLATRGLTFDLCVRHHQLREVTELVARCPDVVFVLDHLGKPDVSGGDLDTWAADLAALAAHPHVRCKLSGLATEAAPTDRSAAGVAAHLDHALNVFGAERCMYGSDWPVASPAIGYATWVDWVAAALGAASSAEQDAVWRTTARTTYGVRSLAAEGASC